MQISPAIHVARDRSHVAWDPAILPVETVASGDVVEFDLPDAAGGQLTAASTIALPAGGAFGTGKESDG
jgi:acetamidase/formamidase